MTNTKYFIYRRRKGNNNYYRYYRVRPTINSAIRFCETSFCSHRYQWLIFKGEEVWKK